MTIASHSPCGSTRTASSQSHLDPLRVRLGYHLESLGTGASSMREFVPTLEKDRG